MSTPFSGEMPLSDDAKRRDPGTGSDGGHWRKKGESNTLPFGAPGSNQAWVHTQIIFQLVRW